ncbi:MAG: histidine ammonia-lyase, partial [Patiriisocius sp.]
TKCLRIIDNIETILAIELMNASQGLAFRDKNSSPFVMSFIESYRAVVPFLEEDRVLADDIHASVAFLQSFSVDSKLLF